MQGVIVWYNGTSLLRPSLESRNLRREFLCKAREKQREAEEKEYVVFSVAAVAQMSSARTILFIFLSTTIQP